ncbi:MAG: hypothetical protein LQ341_001996 [Variospora aurantia]|nr:MAG: hypothetical protein LQ341_001996 [Variospora aurantia]
MLSSEALGFTAFALVALSAGQDFFTQQNGRTRILGSSFGILGINATFDYVIIGGGTAGLTVAQRLATNPQLSIAVVEGGSFYEIDNGNYSQIPAYDVEFSSPDPASIQPLVDWGIVTAPQAWANQIGDQSYAFDKLLPYFQKSPHFTPPDYVKRGAGSSVLYDPNAFSSAGGPLQVSYTNFYQPFSPFVKQGLQELGLENIAGLNSGSLLGFSEFTLTVDPKAAIRSSSETSFLQEAFATSTLQVYQKSVAKRILFNDNKVAQGVIVETAGVQYELSARKEVIVSAGVFRTPQMLMVSGVGPSATLRRLNIPIISALEGVGQGMQDQPYYSLAYKVNATTNSQLLVDPAFAAQATEDFLATQTGPLSSPGGNWVGWEKIPSPLREGLSKAALSDLSTFPDDWPEIELLPLASAAVPSTDSDNYAISSIALLTTTSRGNVTIASTDTNDNPVVSTNWLLTDTDQELAVAGFKRARQLAAAIDITVGQEVLPGPQVQTDEQILQFIRGTVGPIHHASATCAMGERSNPKAVIDPTGKVYGVQGLRVVDASAFPLLPPGHPQASVYMLAEKIADEILNGE